jgi:hypothetical protein
VKRFAFATAEGRISAVSASWFAVGRRTSGALWVGVSFAACGESDSAAHPKTTATTSSTGTDDTTASTGGSQESSSGRGESVDDGSTGGTSESTGVDACAVPDAAAPWLDAHLREVIGTLSGELEVSPGVMLPDRATTTRRGQAAEWLLAHFDAHGIVAVRHDYGSGTNVVARVPATGTSLGTYVVGAHYDSVSGSPGADDNASGTAVVTALGRWLTEMPCRSHDVLLVAFDQEEYGPPGSGGFGLVGSEAFAAKLVDDEEPVISVHTLDMIGWDGDGDRAIELARADAGLFEFYDDVAADVPGLGPLYSTASGSSDHIVFREAGFDAVGLLEEWNHGDRTPHYHQSSDRYDTIDFGYVATAATLVNRAFGRAVGKP